MRCATSARRFAEDVHAAGKPLAVFWTADRSNEPLPIQASVVVREGPYRSRFDARDVVMPGFHEDLVIDLLDGEAPVRDKGSEPIVGFCGLAGRRTSWKHRAKLVAYHARNLATQRWMDVSPYKGENLRAAAIEALSNAPGVRTNFLVRDRGVFFVDAPASSLVDVRRDYVQNALDSDYLIVCRGSGNCFTRLYEAMCLGRIPVFIDTDCVLPWEDRIDWRASCVYLDESDLPNLGERVRAFHDSLSPEEFRSLQLRNRQLWLQHLSPRGFFSTLTSHWSADRGCDTEHAVCPPGARTLNQWIKSSLSSAALRFSGEPLCLLDRYIASTGVHRRTPRVESIAPCVAPWSSSVRRLWRDGRTDRDRSTETGPRADGWVRWSLATTLRAIHVAARSRPGRRPRSGAAWAN